MRRVVGGDGVDGSVGEGGLDGSHVARRTQRRVDLEARVVGSDGLVGECEVVGGGLCRHRHLGRLCGPDHGDGHGRRQVQEVHGCPRPLGEGDVARHHHGLGLGGDSGDAEAARPVALVHVAALGQVGVLTVLGEGDPEGRGVFEGPAHEAGVLHTGAVVGEQAHTQRRHLAQRRQLVSSPTLGDGTRDADVAAGVDAEVEHLAHGGGRVDRRLGVGHGHDGGEPSDGGPP